MLVEFQFKNFKSFKHKQTFSMVAGSDDSLPNNIHPVLGFGDRKILTSAGILGANASGKSNVIEALAFIKRLVVRSDQFKPNRELGIEAFLLDRESKNVSSEFKLVFIQNGVRYQYLLKVNNKQVLEEELTAYPKGVGQLWYARISDTEPSWKPDFEKDNVFWKFGSSLKGKAENKRLASVTRPNVLFLSQAVMFNNKLLKGVYDWFDTTLQTFNMGENDPLFLIMTTSIIDEDVILRSRLLSLLQQADLGIADFEVREEDEKPRELSEEMSEPYQAVFKAMNELLSHIKQEGAKSYEFFLLHNTFDPETKVQFPLEKESFGTRKLLERGGMILSALERGQVLVIDELDASLHPLLLRNLIALFHNPDFNPKGAQLIFNTHDTTLLDANISDSPLLRRDQIWLVEKNNRGESSLYSLWDFKAPRRGEALQKGYLTGRYGAIPIINDLQTTEDYAKEEATR